MKGWAVLALALICAAGPAGCGQSDTEDRGARAVGLCRDHGGVVALEDEIVICRDQTFDEDTDDRSARAVGLCRDQGGVVALEDEIVICRNQTFHDDTE